MHIHHTGHTKAILLSMYQCKCQNQIKLLTDSKKTLHNNAHQLELQVTILCYNTVVQ